MKLKTKTLGYGQTAYGTTPYAMPVDVSTVTVIGVGVIYFLIILTQVFFQKPMLDFVLGLFLKG